MDGDGDLTRPVRRVRVARRHAHWPGRGRLADDRPARPLGRRV